MNSNAQELRARVYREINRAIMTDEALRDLAARYPDLLSLLRIAPLVLVETDRARKRADRLQELVSSVFVMLFSALVGAFASWIVSGWLPPSPLFHLVH